MKLGVIIYSIDAEIVYNAFRLAIFSLKRGDKVKIFLLASGVTYQNINSERFNISQLSQQFIDHGGKIFACGTCLNLRQQESNNLCPESTMEDLYEIIKYCDKTVSF